MVICFAQGNYINTRATVETAVAPRTAYPEAYAPLRVRTRVQQVRRPCRGYGVGTPRLTFAHVPTQVTETVEGVESERGGEDELASVFDSVGHAGNEFDDVRRVEGGGRDEVSKSVAVQNCVRSSTPRP